MARPGRKQREREKRRAKAARDAASEVLALDPLFSEGRTWHIVRTRARWGDRTCETMGKLDIATVRLRQSEIVIRRNRRVIRSTPILPRTIFVGLPERSQLGQVLAYPGVSEVVSAPAFDASAAGNIPGVVHRPIEVAAAQVGAFAAMIGRTDVAESVGLKVGQQAIVCEGPFASFTATIRKLLPKGRVEVDVSIFGRQSSMRLDRTQLDAA